MENHNFAFLLLIGAAFVTFARPYGKALARHMEGPRTDTERVRHARINTSIARILGAGLIAFGLSHLLGL
jgi:hypothetical protein